MTRKQRLQAAPAWIETYPGKDIVRGYRRWFRVDRLCALVELKMCGQNISDGRIAAARKDQEQRSVERKAQRELQEMHSDIDQDDNFGYIIGYTPGGAPYGLSWDEWNQILEDDCYVEVKPFLKDSRLLLIRFILIGVLRVCIEHRSQFLED